MKECRVLGWNGKEWGKEGEVFWGNPVSIPPHRKPISSISKKNVDEAEKRFREIVLHQTHEK